MKKRVFSVTIICLIIMLLSVSAVAHSGRTDGSGGHKDNKNKSGLGGYHYHCGGYPAHLHKGGVCPYKSGSLSGSSGSSTKTSKSETVYVKDIIVSNAPSNINVGATEELEAYVYPSDAEDKAIVWESSNKNVLAVSSTGKLTAIDVGTAIITAKTSNGVSKKFTITVNEILAESISIVNKDTEILLGNMQRLQCKLMPENTTDTKIEWVSSDDSIVSVSSNGEITANKLGTATITAIHKNLSDTINIKVKPVDAESVKIILPDDVGRNTEGQYKLHKGSQIQIKADVMPRETTYKDIKWSVNNEIAYIDENGILTAHTNGVALVTATANNGVTEEIEIEIYSADGKTVAGIIGVVIAGIGAVFCYKSKKRK